MKELLRRFIIFCGVGVINTLVALAVILALSSYAGFHHVLSNFLGYMFGLVLGFVLHRFITFRDMARPGGIRGEFKLFTVVFAIAYITQLLAVMAMIDVLALPEAFSQIAGVGVYVIISFLGNRALTFSSKGMNAP